MQFLSEAYSDLNLVANQHKDTYQNSPPFPNIYFDEFLNSDFLKKVLAEFPGLSEKGGDNIYYSNPNEKKLATKGEYSFGPNTRQLVHFFEFPDLP